MGRCLLCLLVSLVSETNGNARGSQNLPPARLVELLLVQLDSNPLTHLPSAMGELKAQRPCWFSAFDHLVTIGWW